MRQFSSLQAALLIGGTLHAQASVAAAGDAGSLEPAAITIAQSGKNNDGEHSQPSSTRSESKEPASTPEPDTENTKNTDNTDGLPSLDELLGLTDESTADPSNPETAATAEEQRLRDLDRALSAEEAADAMAEAVRLMDDTASRLGRPGGTGLTTQRMQEDILRKLDQIISSAEQNQGGGSSSGSSQQQQQQGNNAPGSQQSGGQAAAGQGQGNAENMPAQGSEAALGPEQLLDASSWGALPERLRDALSEGLSDSFSAAYRSLTESYYKRLAEEAENSE